MEDFKIEHFARNNEGVSFPHYESLSLTEKKEIRMRLCQRLGFPSDVTGRILVSEVGRLQTSIVEEKAKNVDFNLIALVEAIGIDARNDVFVNWYQFDKIDKLALEDLSQFFHDIWYPASDDIDIFDSSLAWIISVSHEGSVRFVQL